MGRPNPLAVEVARLKLQVADMARRQENSFRYGTVASVDAARQMVRLKIGKGADGTDQLSPWIPYAQMAGALKVHTPMSEGQNMAMISPGGDIEQAIAMPFTWNNANQSPSQSADENVLTYGDVKMTLIEGGLRIEVGGFVLAVTGAGLAMAGGGVGHNGQDIGSTHRHPGIQPGGGITSTPIAAGPTP